MLFVSSCTQSQERVGTNKSPSHQPFTELLEKYVKGDRVNYNGLQNDQVKLNQYCKTLSEHAPSPKWTKNEKLAYWINAYNAFTLKLIIDNYPINSITELHPTIYIPGLNTVWHKKFFKIGGVETSLDEIEHEILRKEFDEPRIHFAINCASLSCPQLRNEAYEPDNLEEQFEEQALLFISDPKRNRITKDDVTISRIFSWFSSDFKRDGSLIEFLNKYSKVHISENAEINYLKYDWNLNDIK